MRTPNLFVEGVGVHLPDTMTVESAVEHGLCPADKVDPNGTVSVAVAGELPAPEMALRAAEEAFKRGGQSAADVSLLLYASVWYQGPQGWLPPSHLQDRLIGGDTLAVELRHGCSGIYSGLELAASYLYADPERQKALLVAADNFGTPQMDRWAAGPFVPGDAASALVLTRTGGFAQVLTVCSATVPDNVDDLARSGEPLFPPAITVGRRVDFNARRAALAKHPEARETMMARTTKTARKMTEVVERALAEADIEIGQITRLAMPNISRELAERRGMFSVGVDTSKTTWEFGRTIGHCGASDPVLSLDHLLTNRQLNPGDHFMMLSSGAGVVVACSIIRILDTPPWL